MRKRILPIAVIAALIVCILCFAGCGGDSETPSDTAATAEMTQLFKNKDKEFDYGYIACYANPQNDENPDNPDNLYGIMDSQDKVIVKPKYDTVSPLSRDTFITDTMRDGKVYSSLIGRNDKVIIPEFIGEIVTVSDDKEVPLAIIRPEKGKNYIVDASGKKVIDIDFDSVYLPIETRRHVLSAYTAERAYYISYGGEIIAEFPANKVVLDPFGECKGSTVIACMYKVPEAGKSSILYGLYDSSSGRELVPCSRKEGYPINEERFVLKDTCLIGPEYDDFAAIYDKSGNVICGGGKYQDIDFTYGSSYGIGFAISPTETYYNVINTDGKAVGGKYDSIEKDTDGNFVCKKGDQTETIKSVK